MSEVALLHPGAMGSRVGGELVRGGHQVSWLSAGRSADTETRARREGLCATATPAELLREAEVVISVCPPQGALDVARLVAGAGFTGTYVDANPVSPGTLTAVAALVEHAGARFVDAGIVGPPPRPDRRTHLYLAGPPRDVAAVAALFAGSRVTTLDLGSRVGAASAAKQAYALFNKGRTVLAQAAAQLAAAHDVTEVLAGEAGRSDAALLGDLDEVEAGLRASAYRWAPEFREIAASLSAADLDPALAQGLAALLDRLQPPVPDRPGR